MKAIVYRRYGRSEALHLEEVDKPIPRDDEALVKVHAASVNSWDWEVLRGVPRLARLGSGLFRPKRKILGADIAGVVEAVGQSVTRLKPGDEVFGDISGNGWGGLAEFVSVNEKALAPKPSDLGFEDAAAVSQAGVLALQALRKAGGVKPGEKVLINGGGGGVGTFAIQMAKAHGAEVTGVDSAEKLDTMRDVGADHVIDYRREDFAASGQRYDIVVDCQLRRSLTTCRRTLNPGGRYVAVGGSTGSLMLVIFFGSLISMFSGKKTGLLLHHPGADDLDIMVKLIESGDVRPVIDRTFPLADTPEAFRYFGDGHARGKIVILIQ